MSSDSPGIFFISTGSCVGYFAASSSRELHPARGRELGPFQICGAMVKCWMILWNMFFFWGDEHPIVIDYR